MELTRAANSEFAAAVAELRTQGLTVTIHSLPNKTWFIKGEGIYQGYIATGEELLDLKRENILNLGGIKSLG
jgi:hypothetical protein